MRISDLSSSRTESGGTLSARLHPAAGDPLDLHFHIEGTPQAPALLGDAFAVGMLVPCMSEGENLTVEAPVSAALLTSIHTAQEVLNAWYPDLNLIEVKADEAYDAPTLPREDAGVACCFSGGVDSWYSVRKNIGELTHLLLVRGFDIPIQERGDALWELTRGQLAKPAEELGLRLVTVATNLRELADKSRAGWGTRFDGEFWGSRLYGSSLAAVALSVQATLGQLIIPASYEYALMRPWGSHPFVDPMWFQRAHADRARRSRGDAAA